MMDPRCNKNPFIKIYYLKNQAEKDKKNQPVKKPTVSFLSSLIQKQKNIVQSSQNQEQAKSSKRRQLNQKISNIDLSLQQQTKNRLINKQEWEPLSEPKQNLANSYIKKRKAVTFQTQPKRAQTSEQRYIDKLKQINSGRYFLKNNSLRERNEETDELSDQTKNFLSNVVANWKNFQAKKLLNGTLKQIAKKKYSIQQKNQLKKNKHIMKQDFQIFLGNYTQKLKDQFKKPVQFNLQEYLKEQDNLNQNQNKIQLIFTKPNMLKRLSKNQGKKEKTSQNHKTTQYKIHPSVLGQQNLQNFQWASLAQKQFNIKNNKEHNLNHKKRHSII